MAAESSILIVSLQIIPYCLTGASTRNIEHVGVRNSLYSLPLAFLLTRIDIEAT